MTGSAVEVLVLTIDSTGGAMRRQAATAEL